jgi:hypothetical protein
MGCLTVNNSHVGGLQIPVLRNKTALFESGPAKIRYLCLGILTGNNQVVLAEELFNFSLS